MYKCVKKGNTLTKYKILGGVKMRRDIRKKENAEKSKNILYIGGSILGLGIIAFVITFILYGNKMDEQSDLGNKKIATLMQENADQTQSASTQMGKTVEESKNEIINVEDKTNQDTNSNKTTTKNTNTTKTENKVSQNNNSKKENTLKEQKSDDKTENKTVKQDVKFIKPVEGEISKQYAKENLLYSETLEEWTTHLGIDIKAEKTTVVKAVADGKVKSIKNDPRYGLSIIIEHQDGYETLYANLLTSEFVQVGEEVKQGASIGTVGNTATFEILDEPHLHFEISKDGQNLDPNEYIK